MSRDILEGMYIDYTQLASRNCEVKVEQTIPQIAAISSGFRVGTFFSKIKLSANLSAIRKSSHVLSVVTSNQVSRPASNCGPCARCRRDVPGEKISHNALSPFNPNRRHHHVLFIVADTYVCCIQSAMLLTCVDQIFATLHAIILLIIIVGTCTEISHMRAILHCDPGL